MSNLFSHAELGQQEHGSTLPAAEGDQDVLAAVVEVPVAMDQAWEGFTEYIHLWWPAEFTTSGPGTHVEVAAESVGEESEGGERQDWARITAAEPPRRLELAWTRGRDPLTPARVVIDFADMGTGGAVMPEAGGTRVSVTEEEAGRATATDMAIHYPGHAPQPGQAPGWRVVLERYARFMGSGT